MRPLRSTYNEATSRQINVTLADDIAVLIESVPVTERDRSIDNAIRQHDAPVWQDGDLRRLLQEGAIARGARPRYR
jgi:hypothetical protein